jgi:hypothetical protein
VSDDRPEARPARTPEDWWSTAIIDMKPGMIRFRGFAIEDLIGRVRSSRLNRGSGPHPDPLPLGGSGSARAVLMSGRSAREPTR